jgi:hypothetical protein
LIKEALQYIIGLGTVETKEIGEQIYSTQPIHSVKQATPAALTVRNLSGLVDYLVNNFDKQPPVLVHVESPTEVSVYSTYNRDFARNHLLQASALLPKIPYGSFQDTESFNILLQSCFVPNEHSEALLAVVGNISEENVTTVGDNGVSQQVTAKTGIATRESVVVPNPVHLKPFRTFVEIKQPESQFVFRMQSGPKAAIFEADGGSWKLEAIYSIKEHLKQQLASQIESGAVTIIG